MKVNARKSKLMVLEKDERLYILLQLKMKIWHKLRTIYLSSVFMRDRKCDGDIERKLTARICVSEALHAYMSVQTVPKEARLALHKGVLFPSLKYVWY